MQVAQHGELLAVGGGVSATLAANLTGQPVASAICSRVTPGMDGDDGQLLGLRVGLQHAQVGDDAASAPWS